MHIKIHLFFSIMTSFLLILCLNFCSKNHLNLIKDGDVYRLSNNKLITLSFVQSLDVSFDILDQSVKILEFLIHKELAPVKTEIHIEGLQGELFHDFMMIADTLCDYEKYPNKTILYAYFSSLYEKFSIKIRQYPFIPLIDFQKLFTDYKINLKNNAELVGFVVTYSVEQVYFVSLLELLERPERYFYPKKVKEELYRVLIYPEVLSFWHYMEARFGKSLLLSAAEKSYTAEYFHMKFSEEISNIEASYVKSMEVKSQRVTWMTEDLRKSLDEMLFCYMSGTKKRLFSD